MVFGETSAGANKPHTVPDVVLQAKPASPSKGRHLARGELLGGSSGGIFGVGVVVVGAKKPPGSKQQGLMRSH